MKGNKKRILLLISGIFLFVMVIGFSYAFFATNIIGVESASTMAGTAAYLELTFADGEDTITGTNIIPGWEASKSFTVTNTGEASTFYNIYIENIVNTFTVPGSISFSISSSDVGAANVPITELPSANSSVAYSIPIDVSEVHHYIVTAYYNSLDVNQIDDLDKSFSFDVSIISGTQPEPKGWSNVSSNTLLWGIRKNYPSLSLASTVPGEEASASGQISTSVYTFCGNMNDCSVTYYNTKQDAFGGGTGTTGNYSTVYSNLAGKWIWSSTLYYVINATESQITYSNNDRVFTKESNIMLASEDDYGTSYYFRGDVTNNYVSFAGMCWRIVRVDGAGNIRLTLYNYNPTSASNPCASSLDGETKAFARIIENDSNSYSSAFNTNYNKNTYIGYMYSNTPDSSDYLTGHANDNDSTILTNLKSWYDRVFTPEEKSLLADVIWCNDKRTVTDTSYDPWYWQNVLGTGTGTDTTFYRSTPLLYAYNQSTSSYGVVGTEPSLKCGDSKTDNLISKFTASTSTDGGYGNGALNNYKIGLLTAHEVAFAGANAGVGNNSYYLYKNANEGSHSYFTLSPIDFNGNYAVIWAVNNYGSLGIGRSSYEYGVRPTIALKPSTVIESGQGTQLMPFKVNTPLG